MFRTKVTSALVSQAIITTSVTPAKNEKKIVSHGYLYLLKIYPKRYNTIVSAINNPEIGVLAESSLHAALKSYYTGPGDRVEEPINGYLIDIQKPTELLEIQTKNFGSMKAKLDTLLENHIVRIIHPLIQNKTIIRVSNEGEIVSRRKSPKQGQAIEVFKELMRIPKQSLHPNFRLTVVLVNADEYWLDDGQGSWRRKHWSIRDRKISKIIKEVYIDNPEQYLTLLPDTLPDPFTNSQLKKSTKISPRLAGKVTFTLREMNLIQLVGKEGKAYLFSRTL
jgi:hypothetical protein